MRKLGPAVSLLAIFVVACPRSETSGTVDKGAPTVEAASSATTSPSAAAAPSTAGPADAAPSSAPVAFTGPRLYVSNETSGDVTVIDVGTSNVIDTIAVGKRPRGIQRAPDGSTVYVALSGSVPNGPAEREKGDKGDKKEADDRSADAIGVIDTRMDKLVCRLPSGIDPEQLAVSLDGASLFISSEDAAEMSIVDIAKKKIDSSYKVGEEPEGVGVSPDGKWVYVTCEATNEIHVFDLKAKKTSADWTRPRPSLGTRCRGLRTPAWSGAPLACEGVERHRLLSIALSSSSRRCARVLRASGEPSGRMHAPVEDRQGRHGRLPRVVRCRARR
jgi:YVTN family beta-propeller protein